MNLLLTREIQTVFRKIKINVYPMFQVPNMEFVAVVNVYVKTSIMGMYAT